MRKPIIIIGFKNKTKQKTLPITVAVEITTLILMYNQFISRY